MSNPPTRAPTTPVSIPPSPQRWRQFAVTSRSPSWKRTVAPSGSCPTSVGGATSAFQWGGSLSDLQGAIVLNGVHWDPADVIREAGLVSWHFDHLSSSQTPFRAHHRELDESPYMDMTDGFTAYRDERRRRGSRVIPEAERKLRKLSREVGPIRFEPIATDPGVLIALVTWKRRQLRQLHAFDPFRLEWVRNLLDVIGTKMEREFRGVVSGLYAGDRLVAAQIGMLSHGMFASWIPAFDDAYARYSPGLLLQLELAKAAADMSVTRIDLGRGSNQLKQTLMSGTELVALGAVGGRPIERVMVAAMFGVRAAADRMALDRTRRLYQRSRAWVLNYVASWGDTGAPGRLRGSLE